MYIIIDEKSLNYILSKSFYKNNDIFFFKREIIIENKKDMKVYIFELSENEIYI